MKDSHVLLLLGVFLLLGKSALIDLIKYNLKNLVLKKLPHSLPTGNQPELTRSCFSIIHNDFLEAAIERNPLLD